MLYSLTEHYKGRFHTIPNVLIDFLPSDLYVVFVHIYKTSRKVLYNGKITLSQRSLARSTRMCRKKITKCLEQLEALNLIAVNISAAKSTSYHINWEEVYKVDQYFRTISYAGIAVLDEKCISDNDCIPFSELPEEYKNELKEKYPYDPFELDVVLTDSDDDVNDDKKNTDDTVEIKEEIAEPENCDNSSVTKDILVSNDTVKVIFKENESHYFSKDAEGYKLSVVLSSTESLLYDLICNQNITVEFLKQSENGVFEKLPVENTTCQKVTSTCAKSYQLQKEHTKKVTGVSEGWSEKLPVEIENIQKVTSSFCESAEKLPVIVQKVTSCDSNSQKSYQLEYGNVQKVTSCDSKSAEKLPVEEKQVEKLPVEVTSCENVTSDPDFIGSIKDTNDFLRLPVEEKSGQKVASWCSKSYQWGSKSCQLPEKSGQKVATDNINKIKKDCIGPCPIKYINSEKNEKENEEERRKEILKYFEDRDINKFPEFNLNLLRSFLEEDLKEEDDDVVKTIKQVWNQLGYDEELSANNFIPLDVFYNILYHSWEYLKTTYNDYELSEYEIKNIFGFLIMEHEGEDCFCIDPSKIKDVNAKYHTTPSKKKKDYKYADRVSRRLFLECIEEIAEKDEDKLTSAEFVVLLLMDYEKANKRGCYSPQLNPGQYELLLKEFENKSGVPSEDIKELFSSLPGRFKVSLAAFQIIPDTIFIYNEKVQENDYIQVLLDERLKEYWENEEEEDVDDEDMDGESWKEAEEI